MILDFRRGDRDAPVGHALVYFQGDSGTTLASYIMVPPIRMDISKYMPPMFSSMMQGIDLGDAITATPFPPIPEPVESENLLFTLAERRQDDLIYGGYMSEQDPMRLAAELSEVVQAYAQLYTSSVDVQPDVPAAPPSAAVTPSSASRYSGLSQQEQLNELTALTGRLRDSVAAGVPDSEVQAQMRELAVALPAKYRVPDLIEAASIPGDRGQRLAELYLERSFKLFHEDYLDLERIDRAIDENRG